MIKQEEIWSLATKEEFISALWMIAAMIAFTSGIELLKYVGVALFGMSAYGFYNYMEAARLQYIEYKRKQNSPQPKKANFVSKPLRVKATFITSAVNQGGDYQWETEFNIPSIPFEEKPNEETWTLAIDKFGKDYLVQHTKRTYSVIQGDNNDTHLQ